MTKILIIGGVAGGASAAARARRLSEDAEIIMFERGPYISFANCGLPYHIGGDIEQRDALLLQTPESFKARFNVDVRVMNEVVSINRQDKTLTIRNLSTQENYQESYDKLVLSPGASPIVPPIPGIQNSRTFSLRNIPDMDKIIASIEHNQPKHATVVGGGFIGIEMAEALIQRGINTSLVELSQQVMAPVDSEMAAPLHQEMQHHGVDLRLGVALEAVFPSQQQAADELASVDEQGLELRLSNGDLLETELLIMAIGVKPETSLARQANLNIGKLGGIQVNSQLQTSDPDIYAVGDAIEDPEFVTGDAALIPLAGPANRQGRMVANNIFGAGEHYKRSQGTAICKIFDLAVASTGLNEKTLQRKGLDYEKVYVHAASHAGYYPGAHPINLKLLFNPTSGAILGAQAVGKDGVDKRIDVIAVAQRAGLTVFDLQDLELTYAPPFGSAKDVVNQAGFVAANSIQGDTRLCHSDEINQPSADQLVLDVRNPGELEKLGAIPGAVNIPVDQLRERINELPKDKEILVYCMVGLRGNVAYRQLVNHGFKAKNLTGGYKTWLAAKA
ncbi:CoA-disulfide reductase [Agarivorans sp. B2Z047]|uniref:FAD-dependent oxidoreductase n=1 Tax=Agarivorans sp. B2Z047 TaxID=2652721 RepID=UPI00128DFD3E|nr:FAD-dependent oxidoreductase [Agarivorans sp. B2Z047]MPW29830.1 CoA-disulfide reductase [Agarivorans sp. B2Z047]UQN43400.1 FAD-dependent oxidoreductase [Agarivorans sp. B2Z047]